ncbi:MAG: hypothetical protein L6R42_006469, partial [Xanthoria sp. 1 TBL-2021]
MVTRVNQPFEADSLQQSTGSEDHDDGDSTSTERPITANEAVLVNNGYLMPPPVVRGTGYIVWQFAHGG